MAYHLALVALFAHPAHAASDATFPAPQPVPVSWAAHKGATVTATELGTHVEAPAGGIVSASAPLDWSAVSELRIDIATEAEATVEIRLAEPDGSAWYWRRVDLASGDNALELPLAWFRWSADTHVPSWEKVDTVAMRFRDATTAELGELRTVAGSPLLTSEHLASVVARPLQRLETPAVRLLWDAPELDGPALTEHLGQVSTTLAELLPWLPAPTVPPALVVLPDRESYSRYVARLGLGYYADSQFPGSSGFTLQGVGVAYWDPAQGTQRPTYTHEYAHAWLAESAHLPSDRGDWIQEGLAALVQLRFHPQDNFAGIVCDGLENKGHRRPLAELVDGRRLPVNRYWQAVTMVEHLLAEHGGAMPELFEALYEAGSADLMPHLGPVLGVDVEEFERAWMEGTRGRYCMVE